MKGLLLLICACLFVYITWDHWTVQSVMLLALLVPLVHNIGLTETAMRSVFYSHNWDSEQCLAVTTWMQEYVISHKIWSRESFTNIAMSKAVHWWDTSSASLKPQTRECPCRYFFMFSGANVMLVHISEPRGARYHSGEDEHFSLTLYSLTWVNWEKLVSLARDRYFSVTEKRCLTLQNAGLDKSRLRNIWSDLLLFADRSMCFGNAEKLKCWDCVESFFESTTKSRYSKLGIPYRRVFLAVGLPGTGKSYFIKLLHSYLFKKYHIPMLQLQPRGMSDQKLSAVVSSVQGGIIVVDEYIALKSNVKGSASSSPGYFANKLYNLKSILQRSSPQEISEAAWNISEPENVVPTVSGWQYMLDTSSFEGVIWFTSNNLSLLKKLDTKGSLLRPGRIDKTFHFEPMSPTECLRACSKLSPDQPHETPTKKVMLGTLVNYLKDHDRYQDADFTAAAAATATTAAATTTID